MLAAQHQAGNMWGPMTRLGEYNHLITGSRLGICGFSITLVEFSLKLFIYWWQCDWGWHFFFPFFYLPHAFPSILLLFRNHSLEAYSTTRTGKRQRCPGSFIRLFLALETSVGA